MNQPLTLLQRGVMKRLSDQGYSAFAEQLRARWIHGERADLKPMAERISGELAEDLKRANAQAIPE